MESKKERGLLKKCERLLMLCFFVYLAFMARSYMSIMPAVLNHLVGYNNSRAEVSHSGKTEDASLVRRSVLPRNATSRLVRRSAIPRYDNLVPESENPSARFYATWRVDAATQPVNKSPSDRRKVIIWNPTSRWPTPDAVPCLSLPQCEFVRKKRRMKTADADAIIFRGIRGIPQKYRRSWFPRTRPEHQIWVYFPFECPHLTKGIDLVTYAGVFNWTMSYRNDSDILAPWGHITQVYKALAENPPTPDKDYARQKNRLAIWYVSDCFQYLSRTRYAAELMKHVRVDVFGACGNASECVKGDRACLREHVRQYKFYLAFENFRCVEYVTEKFWHNSLDYDIVPIVYGAPKEDYRRFAPPNSFIHVDDFASPEALANYLKHLDRNDDEYNRYFAWKTNPPKNLPELFESRFCDVCRKLLRAAPTERKVYTDLDRWWRGENYELCEPIVWEGWHKRRKPKHAAHFT
ncbi:alpha-(1,3)-fucosyltransferase 7-like [Branchiostoma floridae x Branchiostoma belcheri]